MPRMNPDQKQAVEHTTGPLLVLAGAGSGKTMVVTHRIARLIEKGTPAKSILAVTFTNKAAEEMRVRLERLVGPSAKQVTMSTFHAFGLRILRSEVKRLGFEDGKFTIFDQADQVGVIRETLRSIRGARRLDVWSIMARISNAKSQFVLPERYKPRRWDEYDEITAIVYPRYVEALRGFRAFDFDDLIVVPVQLLQTYPDVLQKWRSKYWQILVDEYQDTNHAQLELIRLLGAEHRNVCVVGDDDQSIYAWRGADVSNILNFEQHFAGAKVVKLQNNYRSTESILAVANAVIEKSTAKRHDKRLIHTTSGGEPVLLVVTPDAEIEASFIADEIKQHIARGVPAKEIAVLYRSNKQSSSIEVALKERHVPVHVVGGTQFYERKEVKDMLSYLRVVINPRDELSLRRIINYPARGIGATSLERLTSYAVANDIPLWVAVVQARMVERLPEAAVRGCEQLVDVVIRASKLLDSGVGASRVARQIAADVDLERDIVVSSNSTEAADRRKANLAVFYKMLERFDEKQHESEDALAGLLDVLMLRNDEDDSVGGNRVTLTTMHGAKGLEFDVVFIAGLEEGLMPHARTIEAKAGDATSQDMEEERRLLYVAITRAKKKLYMTRAKTRAARGKGAARVPSRFLRDIPNHLVEQKVVHHAAAPSVESMREGIAALLAAIEKD